MSPISRREFLRIGAAAVGAAASGPLLAACGQGESPAATLSLTPTAAQPTATTAAQPTVTISATATVTPIPVRRPEVIKMFPDFVSRVIKAKHPGVWTGDSLEGAALRQMLDASITRLTGLNDAKEAWLALFSPDEKVAIKVNNFRNSKLWTHPELVHAVTQSMIDAGIPAEQLYIYDARSSEMTTVGYTLNPDGPGVRVVGTDKKVSGYYLWKGIIKLSDILHQCDAVINMPVLKQHGIAGMTFAMKNHFGSADKPEYLHEVTSSISALNSLPLIKDKTRLVIGDMLGVAIKGRSSWPFWQEDARGESILMTHDPLAADVTAWPLLGSLMEEGGVSPEGFQGVIDKWMSDCASKKVGASTAEQMEIVDLKVN